MRRLVHIFALLMLLSACGGNIGSTLDRAEALVDSLPDSAYAILSEISWPTIQSERECARYGLVATQALSSLDREPESDSMIDFALEYYDRADVHDPIRLAKALYYNAVAKTNSGRNATAIAYAMRARDIAAAENMPLWEARAWSRISFLYSQSFDYYHAIEAARNVVTLYRKTGSLWDYQNSVIEYILLYTAYGRSQEGLAIYDSLWLPEKPVDSEMADYARLARAEQLLHAEMPEKALASLDSIDSASSYLDTSNIFDHQQYLLVRIPILVFLGRTEEARRLIDRLRAIGQPDNFELTGILSNYYKEIGKLDSAVISQELHTDQIHDQVHKYMANSALSAGLDHYRDQYQLKQKREKELSRKMAFYCGLLCVLLFVSFVIIRILFKLRRAEIDGRLKDIELLRNDLESHKSRLKELEETFEKTKPNEKRHDIYTNIFHKFDKLISDYNYHKSLPGKKEIEYFEKELAEFFTPDYFLTIEEALDRANSGMLTELRQRLNLDNENRRLVALIVLGFSNQSIATILNLTKGSVQTRKYRILKRAQESGWEKAELLRKIFEYSRQ